MRPSRFRGALPGLLLVALAAGCGTVSGPALGLDAAVAGHPAGAPAVAPAPPGDRPAAVADGPSGGGPDAPATVGVPAVDAPVAVARIDPFPLVAPLSIEGLSTRDNELWLRDRTTDGAFHALVWSLTDDAPAAQPRDADDDYDDEYADEFAEYDPFERVNEVVFRFNYNVDRYVLRPVARVYNKVMPEPFQVMISNGFDNIGFVPRVVNSALQGKWGGAGRELARFLINSTAGIGGLFDPAGDYWGIVRSREDFGQTLGWYGVGPGPYLILPFLEPLTVRDGIGRGVDSLLDPLSWLLPLFWERVGMTLGNILNERSLNLELFQGFEEGVIDLYSAVRHGYLQRRQQLIKE